MSPRDIFIQHAILKTVAFFDVLGYAPAWSECAAWVEWEVVESWGLPRVEPWGRGVVQREIGEFTNSRIHELSDPPNSKPQTPNPDFFAPPSAEELVSARETLCGAGVIEYGMGRIALAGRLERHLATFFERMPLQARKLRKARRIAAVLAHVPGVRFVALANSTAFGHARDGADLDFFIITQAGRLWTVRALAAGPFRLLGKLSKPVGGAPDAPCFSYFVTDAHLDLSSHQLQSDDPYFRYWFLSLLPLYDDGVGEALWAANAVIRARHPRAMKWMAAGYWPLVAGLKSQKPVASSQKPNLIFRAKASFSLSIERIARQLQRRWFPARIRERMNAADASVIVSDDVLKFHVDDARAAFRDAYKDRLRESGIANNETMEQ